MRFDWKSLVKTVAPVLGTALGGPFGGMATKWLSGQLLGDEDAGEDALAEAIGNANPEMFAKIRALNQDFEKEMARIGLEEKQLVVDDRKNARELFKVNIWPQIVLSIIYITGYFTILGVVLTGAVEIDPTLQPLVNVLIGVITGTVPMIMQFWFGSSLGSKEKTKHLAK